MKAKDLDVNGEYLSNRLNRDWETNTYTGFDTPMRGDVRRVRVLEPVTRHYRFNEKSRQYEATRESWGTTTGLLVAVLHPETGDFVGNAVVSASSIRGPWESTWAMVQDNRARRAALVSQERQAYEASRARVLSALGRIEAATGRSGMYVYDSDRAVVNVNVLEAVADLLDAR